jgi:type VI secretion system protein ImpG
MFALYVAPAINLFEKTTDRLPVKSHLHEFHIVPDRSRYLDFEPHRVLDVFAHYAGGKEKIPVRPLYSASLEGGGSVGNDRMFYTVRRLPRRRTARERQFGLQPVYLGTDMYVSLSLADDASDESSVIELSIRALCSNRHLPEQLPIGASGADFRFLDDVTLDVVCVAGPTRPREPVVSYLRTRSETAHLGTVTWRLLNMLSMNQLGLVERGGGRNAAALREVLSMFADLADKETERKIRGVSIAARWYAGSAVALESRPAAGLRST